MEKLKTIPKVYWYLLITLVFAGYFAWRNWLLRASPVLVSEETKSIVLTDNALTPGISGQSFYYEVFGQVKHPGVFETNNDLLVEEAINRAGGFSTEADLEYVYRYIALAVKVKPEQKIYIPKINEAVTAQFGSAEAGQGAKLNLNLVSSTQLEEISGVGPAIAKKILSGRPYHSCSDVNKLTGVNKTTKENIITSCLL